MNRALLNGALLVAAAALVAVAVVQLRRESSPPPASLQRSDYVLRDYELVTLNEQGREAFTVRGPYLQRDVAGKSLSLVQPRFSFPHPDGRWNARSEAAWVSPGAEQVHLLRRVRLAGPPGAEGQSRLAAERLVVFPDTQEVRSADRVTVTRGNSILAGTGLRADLKARRYQLLDQVKGTYEPR